VDTIVRHLEGCGYQGEVVRLTGDTGSRKDRRLALARFAAAESRVLVATDVAGEGLNLHEHCHHLVHFELPWNPNRMEQRNGRIDRYGQKHPPIIAFLYAEDSYEGEVLKRLVLKIEAQMRMLGSVGDVLGQIQADRIEELLSRPASDVHRAIAETLISAYEDLRQQAIGGSSSGGLGMALFLGQGMVAWMRACSWVSSTAPDNSRRSQTAAAPLPNDLRGEIVLVLAAMALNQAPEIRP
jgi:superfamily II DNA/RNA helicase